MLKKTMYKILSVGEALIDKFNINGKITEKVGGAPINVAAAASKFNVPVTFVGAIGNDHFGLFIKKILLKEGINTSGLVTKYLPTTVAYVEVDSDGERSFKFKRGADENLKFTDISKSLLRFDILHLGSATAMLGGKLWETYNKLLNSSKNKIIIFDPNYRKALYEGIEKEFISKSLSIIKKSDIVKVSLEELEILTGLGKKEGSEKLIELGAKIVFITLGEEGTYVATSKFQKIVKSVNVKQVDSTGAGDAFIGYIAGSIAKDSLSKIEIMNKNIISQITKKANISASLTVTNHGGLEAIPNLEEVEKVWKNINKL